VAALLSGCKEPPLSQEELAPYIDDLIELLGCPPGDHLLAVPPGQPFKLHLWYRLASFLGDSDAHFLLDLVQGVPLGVNETLAPSPAWPTHTGTVANPEPLLQCSDSWKGAQDHPDIVDQLVEEELQAGFIELVPGGLNFRLLIAEQLLVSLALSLLRGDHHDWWSTVQSAMLPPTRSYQTT